MQFPLANYTHYSLGLGLSKPKDLVDYCVKNNMPACGIADYKSISGAVDFYKHAKNAGIKPIIGCTFNDYRLFAKNPAGWIDLAQIVSSIDKDGNHDAELTKEKFSAGNLIKRELHEDIESYYPLESDKPLHDILICSKLKKTLSTVKGLSSYDGKFLRRSNIDIQEIYESVEDIDLLHDPTLPTFPTPNKQTEEEYLKSLCRIGWEKFIANKVKDFSTKKQQYLDRFLKEFEVIKEANLFGYFLIVQDIIKFAQNNRWMTGPGRGCFLPDTRVKMSNGLMKNISDISVGDKIIDCDGNEQLVYDTLIYEVDEEIMELSFREIVIRCTKDHKFLTKNRGWVEAQYLTEDDDVVEV